MKKKALTSALIGSLLVCISVASFAQEKKIKTGLTPEDWAYKNEMSTLTVPANVPKTIEDYRKRVEPPYGGMVKELDAVYPVRSAEDVVAAYLGGLRDATFRCPCARGRA